MGGSDTCPQWTSPLRNYIRTRAGVACDRRLTRFGSGASHIGNRMMNQSPRNRFGPMLYCTVALAAIGYCVQPYGPESRAREHHSATKQMLNTISGALVGAALGLSINIASSSFKQSESRQISLRAMFASVFLFSMICYSYVWYRYAISGQLSGPSKLVRFISE